MRISVLRTHVLPVAAAVVLLGAGPALAFSVIHSHAPGAQHPRAGLVQDALGNLYGTTYDGGSSNRGTLFRVRTDGTNFEILHAFTGSAADGAYPYAGLILDGSGNLYGTTYNGGASNRGTVFCVKTDGTNFQVLHSFAGGASDGANPQGSLVSGLSGNLYGTTSAGGTSGRGTVFNVKTDGTGFQLLHTFTGGANDGQYPYASVILDGAGNLYGTTGNGGTSDQGTVFHVKTDGTDFQVLVSLGGASGANPYGSVVLDGSGTLYGTTSAGGSGAGTVFRVDTNGTNFQVLHTFSGGASDGQDALASLVLDASGNLYGTTYYGGVANAGTVFSVRTDGTSFQLLHVFSGAGANPSSALVLDASGILQGTTYQTGMTGPGTVFGVRTDGTSFQVLFTFPGPASDGANPYGSLTRDASGNLYGTTYQGGASNLGAVFRMRDDGTEFQLLHTFTGGAGDGSHPYYGALVLDGLGNLYGTTVSGGASDFGTVFRVKNDGTGYQLLHAFTGPSDGKSPYASLVADGSGNLYGTTTYGGASDRGTVFGLKTDGTNFHLLHTFTSGAADGQYPYASLLLDGSGNLYGTTYDSSWPGDGTVFRIKTDGTSFQLVHTFTGGASDGQYPWAAVILDAAGNLYGTTYQGGASGLGTVFRVKTDGTGFQLLHTFTGGAGDGARPAAALVLDGAGNLYGTTYQGGASNLGTVFSVKTDGTGFQLQHTFAGAPGDGQSPFAPLILDASWNLLGTTYQGGAVGQGTEFTLPSLCTAPTQPADFTLSAATVCQGQSNVAYAVPNDPSVTYGWSYSGSGGAITGSGSSVIVSFSATATSGTLSVTAANGCGTSQARGLPITVNVDTGAPAVTAPGPITLDQTTCCGVFGGATAASSPALAAFLGGGNATDDCDPVPTRLEPQIGGLDVTSATCLPAGPSSVTFRFRDAAARIGTADSSVVVLMFGDLNEDGAGDPSDLVILRAYYNSVVTPGVPPFNAPLRMADLDHDAAVDPADMVVMRAYVNLAVACLAP